MTNRILLALDGSALDEAALAGAKRISPEVRPLPVGATGASAHLRGRLPPPHPDRELGDESRVYKWAVQYLEFHRRGLRGIRGQDIVQTGDPAEAILEAALAFNIDLIVMSSRARSGFARWLFGGVSRTVLSRSGLPVLLVRRGRIEAPARTLRRILAASDGSDESSAILPTVASIAARTGAEVTLLHVASGIQSVMKPPDWIQAAAGRFAAAGVPLRTSSVEGRLIRQVLSRAASEDVDLIALSLRGRKRAALLSNSDRPILLQEPATCSG